MAAGFRGDLRRDLRPEARATEWDCWQVVLNPDNAVEVLPIWGNRLEEIRIRDHIKPDQLWLVGSRRVDQLDRGSAMARALRGMPEEDR